MGETTALKKGMYEVTDLCTSVAATAEVEDFSDGTSAADVPVCTGVGRVDGTGGAVRTPCMSSRPEDTRAAPIGVVGEACTARTAWHTAQCP